MIRIRLSAALVLLLTSPALATRPNDPNEVSDDAKALAEGNNQFAIDLYAHLRSEKSGNLFFSPYSLSSALAMTEAGAKGETAKQMADVLHFKLPTEKLHLAFKELQRSLTPHDEHPHFDFRVANRIWAQQGDHLLPGFTKATQDNFGAVVGRADFSQPDAARKLINAWVEAQTDKKIKSLLPSGAIEGGTRLMLTNAVYFKSLWTREFSKSSTAEATFQISAGKNVSLPMMHQHDHFSYSETDGAQLLVLPYGHPSSVSMLIVLPKKSDGLADVEKGLTYESLGKWTENLQDRAADIYLPRFKIAADCNLKSTLTDMGLKLPFSDQADFSGISTDQRLVLSAVIHKALIDVNEEGTEAAAATAVGVWKADAPDAIGAPVTFRADHPFLFLIRDRNTGSILFLGRLTNPKE